MKALSSLIIAGLLPTVLLAQPAAKTKTKTAAAKPAAAPTAPAEAAPARKGVEDDYFKIINVPVADDVLLEVGGLCTLPDNKIAVATRRGEVWIIDNADSKDGKAPLARLFATGMHEPLGLAWHQNILWMSQRGGLTRLIDTNGDHKADIYENVATYPLSGNYHEYAYGPKFDNQGNAYVTLNVGFFNPEWWVGKAAVPWRGWALKISPDGKTEPFAAGLRSPAGIGIVNGKDLFYTDNQGDWVGSGMLMHLERGDFAHNTGSLDWTHLPESPLKIKKSDIKDDGRPLVERKKDIPSIKLPAVWLPHGILGASTSDVLVDSLGAFGPFAGQVFIGDQNHAMISRVSLEKVKGQYQGAAFHFRSGFGSGVMRMTWDHQGQMYVGGTDRGWKSQGPRRWALERLVYTGKVPFEMQTIEARPDGFEVVLTQPADAATAKDLASWKVTSFTYKHHGVYGSPTINVENNAVKHVQVSEDGLRCRLVVDGLRLGYVHQIEAPGLRNKEQMALLHGQGFYTLNQIPDGEKLNVPASQQPIAAAKPAAAAPASHDHSAHAGHVMPVADKVVAAKPAAAPAKLVAAKPAAGSAKRITKMPADWGGKIDQAIQLGTAEGMKYDQTYFEVRANSRVKWTFTNYDDMTHNCVIVKPGKHMEVGKQAIALGINGLRKNYIPESDQVIYHTFVLQPEDSETIFFRAPSVPGDYEFVCTLPGHAASMKGVLRVTK